MRKGFIALLLCVICFGSVPNTVDAARVWSSGCEIQGDTGGNMTNGLEFDRYGSSAATTQVVTGTKRTGASSCGAVLSSSGQGRFEYQYTSLSSNSFYHRFYMYISQAPSADAVVAYIDDDTSGNFEMSLVLTPTRTLKLYDEGFLDSSYATPLNLGQWYRVEWQYRDNTSFDIRIDGVSRFSGDPLGDSTSYFGLGLCRSSSGICSGTGITGTVYFDDIAINSTSGSVQNSWPGDGSIIYLHPDSAGDVNNCSSGNWASVDEVTPDDSSTYCILANNNDILDTNVGSALSQGVNDYDPVALVQVGIRERAASASTESWQVRVKSAAGGTVDSSPTVTHNDTTWRTNGDSTPRTYALTSYFDPTTASPWTITGSNSVENMQIGVTAIDANPDVYISTLWALIEFAPAAGPPPPIVDLVATPSSIFTGQSSDLTWTTSYATSCTASDGWSGSKPTSSGSPTTVSPVTSTTYTLTCDGPGGQSQDSVTVTVSVPGVVSASIDANPTTVGEAGESLLTWSSTNATSCTASGDWSGGKALSGTESVAPSANATYTIDCTGPGGSANDSASITVSSIDFVEPTGSPLNARTNAGPFLNAGGSFQEKGSRPSGTQGVGLGADFFVAVSRLCLGPSQCIADWWPSIIQPAECHFEVKRVTGKPGDLGSTLLTSPCDDKLSLPAKASGWVATGVDRWSDGTSAASAITGCVFTRLVCSGSGVTASLPVSSGVLTHPASNAQTGDGFDFTYNPECNDGINNGGEIWTDYPLDAFCSSFADNSEG